MIDELDDATRTYLSAVGALAVYVAVQDGVPVRVGFCHDPHKTLTYMARRWPRVAFAWMAWFEDSKPVAANFIAAVMEAAPDMIAARRDNHVKAPQPLSFVTARIENLARFEKVVLTPHGNAIVRARIYANRLDGVLATLQHSGEFSAFNHAYRIYREGQRMKGESALPYWAAKEQMRQLIIRWLVTHPRIDVAALVTEIRERFPWFKAYGRTHSMHRSHVRN